MKEIQDMIRDLRYAARYPGNYSVSYICRRAANLMERMMQEQKVQGEWLARTDTYETEEQAIEAWNRRADNAEAKEP